MLYSEYREKGILVSEAITELFYVLSKCYKNVVKYDGKLLHILDSDQTDDSIKSRSWKKEFKNQHIQAIFIYGTAISFNSNSNKDKNHCKMFQ